MNNTTNNSRKRKWRSQSEERDWADYSRGSKSGRRMAMELIDPLKMKGSKQTTRKNALVAFDVLVDVLRFLQLQTLMALNARCSRLFWASLRHPVLCRVHQRAPRVGRPLMLTLVPNGNRQLQNQPDAGNTRRTWKCHLFYRDAQRDGDEGRWVDPGRLPGEYLTTVLSGIQYVRYRFPLFNITLDNIATFLQPMLNTLHVTVLLLLRSPSDDPESTEESHVASISNKCRRLLSFSAIEQYAESYPWSTKILAESIRLVVEELYHCLLEMVPPAPPTPSRNWLFHYVVLHCNQPEQLVALFRFGAGGLFLRSITHRLTIVSSFVDSVSLNNFLRWNYEAVEALADWLESSWTSTFDRQKNNVNVEKCGMKNGNERIVTLTGQHGNAIVGRKSADGVSLIITTLAMREEDVTSHQRMDHTAKGTSSSSRLPTPKSYSVIFAVKRSLLVHCPRPFQFLNKREGSLLTLSIHGPQPLLTQDAAFKVGQEETIVPGEPMRTKKEQKGADGGDTAQNHILQPVDANPELEVRRLQEYRRYHQYPDQPQGNNDSASSDESVWLVLRRQALVRVEGVGFEGSKEGSSQSPPLSDIFPPTLDPSYVKTLLMNREETIVPQQIDPSPRDDIHALNIDFRFPY